jgi:hypothetical protein
MQFDRSKLDLEEKVERLSRELEEARRPVPAARCATRPRGTRHPRKIRNIPLGGRGLGAGGPCLVFRC